MRSDDWQPIESAPLNPYGEAWGPTVLIWNRADAKPWPARFEPWHGWEKRDCGPAWVCPDGDPAIAPEEAVAWMPIAAPWQGDVDRAGVKQSLAAQSSAETVMPAELWCTAKKSWHFTDGYGTRYVRGDLAFSRENHVQVSGGFDDDPPGEFLDWFRKNYPGPDTIIFKPDWHAPRIWRAMLRCLKIKEIPNENP